MLLNICLFVLIKFILFVNNYNFINEKIIFKSVTILILSPYHRAVKTQGFRAPNFEKFRFPSRPVSLPQRFSPIPSRNSRNYPAVKIQSNNLIYFNQINEKSTHSFDYLCINFKL